MIAQPQPELVEDWIELDPTRPGPQGARFSESPRLAAAMSPAPQVVIAAAKSKDVVCLDSIRKHRLRGLKGKVKCRIPCLR